MKSLGGFRHSSFGGACTVASEFTDRDLRAYLLGGLDERKRELLEQSYLADQDLFEAIRGAEQQLVQEYVGGLLSTLDRWRFRRHFASTGDGAVQVAFAEDMARTLLPETHGPSANVRKLWIVGLSAATAASLIVCVALSVQMRRMAGEIDVLRAGQSAKQETVSPPIHLAPPVPQISFMLYPASERSLELLKTLIIPSGTANVTLKASVGSDQSASYRAVLVRSGVGQVESMELQRTGSLVAITVPAERLSDGEYYVTLAGTNSAFEDTYPFFISRR